MLLLINRLPCNLPFRLGPPIGTQWNRNQAPSGNAPVLAEVCFEPGPHLPRDVSVSFAPLGHLFGSQIHDRAVLGDGERRPRKDSPAPLGIGPWMACAVYCFPWKIERKSVSAWATFFGLANARSFVMLVSLWALPLAIILIFGLAFGIFSVVQPRRS